MHLLPFTIKVVGLERFRSDNRTSGAGGPAKNSRRTGNCGNDATMVSCTARARFECSWRVAKCPLTRVHDLGGCKTGR
jgi:hypothetical protein